jgi:glycine/D-amino acid oxidase-like deaminating enzyme
MNLPTTTTVPVPSAGPHGHRHLEHVDRLVVGAGLFGLYGALVLARRGLRVAILDADPLPMMRASQVNQARVHNGYHYPRSLTTALSSVLYYRRFVRDFADAVNTKFLQIYAIAHSQSFMSADGFEMFCDRAGVQCDSVDPDQWFRRGTVEAAYRTDEYSFDAERLRRIMCAQVTATPGVTWYQPARMAGVDRDADGFTVQLEDGRRLRADGILNATYAGTNQVLSVLGEPPLDLKYELCEIILTNVSEELRSVGLTVMDGEYFSLMPYGLSGFHSLTSVGFTPHRVSHDVTPRFSCQARNAACNDVALDNCSFCPEAPSSSWPFVSQMTRHYLGDQHTVRFGESLYAVKTVLKTTEVDDARPTMIIQHSAKPWLTSVLSGKIATIYDLDEAL